MWISNTHTVEQQKHKNFQIIIFISAKRKAFRPMTFFYLKCYINVSHNMMETAKKKYLHHSLSIHCSHFCLSCTVIRRSWLKLYSTDVAISSSSQDLSVDQNQLKHTKEPFFCISVTQSCCAVIQLQRLAFEHREWEPYSCCW